MSTKQNDTTETSVPRDAIMMADLLRQCGATKYEPHVINQLLEVAYKMARGTLEKADNIREHVGRPQISLQDLEYARKTEHNATLLREQLQPEVCNLSYIPLQHALAMQSIYLCMKVALTYISLFFPQLDKELTFSRNIQPFENVPERVMLITPPDSRVNSLAPTYDILPPK